MTKRYGNIQAKVLAALREEGEPRSAYQLLSHLSQDNPRLGPTAIYRALDALIQKGEVRRLETMKAYVACQHSDRQNDCVVTICDDCGAVEEQIASDLMNVLAAETSKSGFAATKLVIEVHGHCRACSRAGAVA